jgi:hypothetical protein
VEKAKSILKKIMCVVGCVVFLAIGGCTSLEGSGKGKLVYKADFEDGDLSGWEATDANAWWIEYFEGNMVLSLHEKKSDYKPPVRSPLNRNMIKDLSVGSFAMSLKMLSTTADYGHRDLCLFFGYQDPSHFYYVHIANKSDAHANSIFIVDGKDRLSIAKTRTTGTKWDDNWHTVKLLRDIKDGTIKVFFDGKTIMTAADKTFAAGKIGVGSFDDTGKFDDVKIWSID